MLKSSEEEEKMIRDLIEKSSHKTIETKALKIKNTKTKLQKLESGYGLDKNNPNTHKRTKKWNYKENSEK